MQEGQLMNDTRKVGTPRSSYNCNRPVYRASVLQQARMSGQCLTAGPHVGPVKATSDQSIDYQDA